VPFETAPQNPSSTNRPIVPRGTLDEKTESKSTTCGNKHAVSIVFTASSRGSTITECDISGNPNSYTCHRHRHRSASGVVNDFSAG
jgi:hypothetical protein